MSRTLLITVGSTLFPSLTSIALSPSFLTLLVRLKVDNLIVQYGKADLVFPPEVDWTQRDHKAGTGVFTYSNNAKGGIDIDGRMVRVEIMRYTDDFEGMIKKSKWVISHAGAGSILTILRTPKPLLVVPNTDLMDNHQKELADALGDKRYLLVSTVDGLLDNLPKLIDDQLVLEGFPPVDHSIFRGILDKAAGFAL